MQRVVREARFTRAVEESLRALADADDGRHFARDGAAGVAVEVELLLAELQHVADHGDASLRIGLRNSSSALASAYGFELYVSS